MINNLLTMLSKYIKLQFSDKKSETMLVRLDELDNICVLVTYNFDKSKWEIECDTPNKYSDDVIKQAVTDKLQGLVDA